jgi:hypothetical protein
MAPTYKISNGKIKVEDKDEMKKRGVRSPNLADALNLTFYQDFDLFAVNYRVGNAASKRRDSYHSVWKKKTSPSWKGR